MISDLLWRCPLCAVNDALVHRPRRLWPDVIDCRQCGAGWRIRRVPGDTFYLTLTHPSRSTDHVAAGQEYALPAWYDAMKATLQLAPIQDAGAPLEPDEILFLASKRVEIEVEKTDELFFPTQEAEPPRILKSQVEGVGLGPGRIFLTDRRIIWVDDSKRGGRSAESISLWLHEINTVYIMFQLILMVNMRLYMLFFLDESVLKWLTYISMVTEQYHPAIQRTIKYSRF